MIVIKSFHKRRIQEKPVHTGLYLVRIGECLDGTTLSFFIANFFFVFFLQFSRYFYGLINFRLFIVIFLALFQFFIGFSLMFVDFIPLCFLFFVF